MEENMIYRIKAQSKNNAITVTVETSNDVSLEKAIQIAKDEVLLSAETEYSNFVVEPICSKDEWEEGVISFCPRCGKNINDQEVGQGGTFDCFGCDTTIEAYINKYEDDEE
ncbi:hypothetical protein OF830_28565 [Bacillus paramycoides]|uniref:hypothetical protein n=1 Tax=Bacillus paramycoides TaxID=2026194 RepID=UPI002243CEAD|nr:hypothetical protein [Bacillus paramycoides]MCW9134704.1 hypothetical protein [Bacillus paramycoides]